ncbi:hypothetical protein V8C35DRAFT_250414, partial [Trichoderma chlorosporum]
ASSYNLVSAGIDEEDSHASAHLNLSIDYDGISLHNSSAAQASSGLTLLNRRMADFVIAWFDEWLNYGEFIAEPNPDNQEQQNSERERNGSGSEFTSACNELSPDPSPSSGCPWHRRYPTVYRHGKWKSCAGPRMSKFHRVKQHIIRTHILPPNLCGRCLEDYKDAEGVQQHQASQYQGSLCQEKKNSPYLRPDEIHFLEVSNGRRMPNDEKLRRLYDNIFPGERIRDPSKTRYKMELASAINRILHTPGASEDTQQTFQRILSATLRVISSTHSQGYEGVKDAVAFLRNKVQHAQVRTDTAPDLDEQGLSVAELQYLRPGGRDEFMGTR